MGGILVGEKTEKLTSPEVTYTNQHGKSQKHKADGEAGEAWALALMWTDRQTDCQTLPKSHPGAYALYTPGQPKEGGALEALREG